MWIALGLLACTADTRTVAGQVKDIWGSPVPEATVVVEGVMERHYTDAEGRFSIDVPTESLVLRAHARDEGDVAADDDPLSGPKGVRVMVGRDGFIKSRGLAVEVPEEADFAPVALELYPEPETPGFYAVGAKGYVALGHQRIQMIGTDLAHHTGIQDIPEETVRPGKVELVFTTRLRPSEIAQMNLHLSRLEFVNKARIKGVFGAEDNLINLWVAKDDVAFDVIGFDTREDYLIQTRDALTPGVYAFHAHDILHEEDERVLYSLPKEQQVAFPFEVR